MRQFYGNFIRQVTARLGGGSCCPGVSGFILVAAITKTMQLFKNSRPVLLSHRVYMIHVRRSMYVYAQVVQSLFKSRPTRS